MSTVVINPSPGEAEVPATQSEVIQADTIETVVGATVEVAAIEAERDVAIAEIQAETTVAVSEATSDETAVQREIAECHRNIEKLTEVTTSLAAMVSSIRGDLEKLSQTSLPSPPESPGETPDSQEAPEEPPRRRKAHRWI